MLTSKNPSKGARIFMPLATKMILMVPIVTTQSSARKTTRGSGNKIGAMEPMSEVTALLLDQAALPLFRIDGTLKHSIRRNGYPKVTGRFSYGGGRDDARAKGWRMFVVDRTGHGFCKEATVPLATCHRQRLLSYGGRR
jgi:hypothetical protein